MAKHENESIYVSMDNTRISEKTFSVPLGFGGYLLTIESDNTKTPPKRTITRRLRTDSGRPVGVTTTIKLMSFVSVVKLVYGSNFQLPATAVLSSISGFVFLSDAQFLSFKFY